jgi:hypothetical protein
VRTWLLGARLKLEFADQVNPEDLQFESHGVRVLVDPKSLQYIDGTELDYTREGLNEGFKFRNPKVKDECGCGESFNVPSLHSHFDLFGLAPAYALETEGSSAYRESSRACIPTASLTPAMPSAGRRCSGARA